jgi:hypothetical protein
MLVAARRRALFAVLATLSLSASAEPMFKGTPVPASMVNGRTLVLSDIGVSIDAPTTAHRWSETTLPSPIEGEKLPASMYICQNQMNDAELPYLFVVAKGKVGELTSKLVDRFVQGLKQGASGGGHGLIFARPETKASGIPFAGKSYRYRYELVSARGDGIMFGYLGATPHALLTTQCITFDGYEPSAFARFSQSIKVRAENPAARAAAAATKNRRMMGTVLGGGLVVAIVVFAAARMRSR